jgi:hypothetical protein
VDESYCEQGCYNNGYGYAGKNCAPGWPSLSFNGFICAVDELVAGWVALSTSSDCSALQGMQNPAVWFADQGQATDTSATFKELRPGVKILAQTVSPCSLGSFIRSSGSVYMHDHRLELLQNTPEKTEAVPPNTACPTVPKTFLNEKSCKFQSTCIPLQLSSAPFLLNPTSLAKFHLLKWD